MAVGNRLEFVEEMVDGASDVVVVVYCIGAALGNIEGDLVEGWIGATVGAAVLEEIDEVFDFVGEKVDKGTVEGGDDGLIDIRYLMFGESEFSCKSDKYALLIDSDPYWPTVKGPAAATPPQVTISGVKGWLKSAIE